MNDKARTPPTTEKDDLEIQKLKLEIDDLRNGWRHTRETTIITALVAIITTLVALGIQKYFEHLNVVSNAAAARKSEFFRARESLAASPPSARVIAALALAPYLRPNQTTDGDADSRTAALSALTGQFGHEDDTEVLRTIGTILGSAGASELGQVADENRFAARDIAGEYGIYMGLKHATNDCATLGPLDYAVSTAIAPLEYGRAQLGANVMYLNCITSHGALFTEYSDGYNNKDTSLPSPVNRNQDIMQIRQRIIHSAKLLAATSIALEAILNDPQRGDLKNADLRNVVLFRVDLGAAHLDGINLSGAYVTGRADKAHLSNADLTQTDLGNVSLVGADLSGKDTKLTCTIFSDFRIWRAGKVVDSSIIFKDAPWWLAAMYSDGKYSQPSWLRTLLHNAPQDFQRRKCGADWFVSQKPKQ